MYLLIIYILITTDCSFNCINIHIKWWTHQILHRGLNSIKSRSQSSKAGSMCTHHTAPTGHNEALQKSGEMDSEAQGQGGSFLKQRHYDKMNGNKRQFHMNITNCSTEHLEWAHLKQQPVAHYSWNCIRQRQNMESWKVIGRNVLNLFLEINNCCNNQQIKSESQSTLHTCALYFLYKWECVETISRGERWCTYVCLHVCVCPVCSCSVSLQKHTI